MSDQRYAGGIRAGISGDHHFGNWPDKVPGRGTKRVGQPCAKCVRCPPDVHPFRSLSYVAYGEFPMCKMHANEEVDKVPVGVEPPAV